MKLRPKKILIGMITFVFLFASAFIVQAMAMGGGMGGTGMYGAQMGGHSGYSGQMGYGNHSNMGNYGHMGSHGGGYGSMGFYYCGNHRGGSSN